MKTALRTVFFLFIFSAAAAAQPATDLPARKDPLVDGSFDLPAPGQTPDFNNILTQANVLTEKGRYEEALQHLVWYYTNSETDPGQKGVRVSFALSDWIELGRRYPKARQALIETRDGYEQRLLDGHGSSGLFQDVDAMNQSLDTEDDTYTLFKSIELRDPKLAGHCYEFIEDELVQRGEYETCRKYVGDPNVDFQKIHHRYEWGLQSVQHLAAMRQKAGMGQKNLEKMQLNRQNALTNVPVPVTPPPFPAIPDPSGILKKSVEEQFVDDTRSLIEILVATGDKADAEKIQREALAILDTPRLESAVDDADAKVIQQIHAAGTGQTAVPSSQN